MAIKYFLLGFFVNLATGFDDAITHIPIVANIAKSRLGKISFALGMLLAICIAIIASVFFSTLIVKIPYYRYIAAGLIFVLAAMIHFDVLVHNKRAKEEKKLKSCCSIKKCFSLFGIGFFAAYATVIDDIIAYLPLFLESQILFTVIGILTATIVQLTLIVYFSEFVAKIKYKDDIAVVGLMILGVLILTGVI